MAAGRIILVWFAALSLALAAPPEELALHPAAAAQPTKAGRRIVTLEPFAGRLYIGYGDYSGNTGPIEVRALDPASSALSEALLRFGTEAIYLYRLVNGRLYAPDIDPKGSTGGYAVGTLTPAGETWSERDAVTATHIFDVATFDGTDLWLFGSRDYDAVAWRSTDHGATWREALNVPRQPSSVEQDFARFYVAFTLNGRLYTQASDYLGGNHPESLVFDGSGWSAGPALLPRAALFPWKALPVADEVVYLSAHAGVLASRLFRFDGLEARLAYGPEVDSAEDRSVFFYDIARSGATLYGLNAVAEVWSTADLATWTRVAQLPRAEDSFPTSIAVMDNDLYIGTSDSRILRLPLSLTPLPNDLFSDDFEED